MLLDGKSLALCRKGGSFGILVGRRSEGRRTNNRAVRLPECQRSRGTGVDDSEEASEVNEDPWDLDGAAAFRGMAAR